MSLAATENSPLLHPERRDQPQPDVPHADEEALAAEGGGDDGDEAPQDDPPDFSVITTLLLGVFIGNADGTLVIAQTGSISSEFNGLSKADWLVTSYFLASCASQPVIGKLSDIYGRKSMLLVSYAFFTVGNFLSGAGLELWQILLGRAVAGIGGGAMLSLVSILIADLIPVRSIAAWRSYVNVAATTGRSLGGPIGGLLTDTVGWRWSFYIQCPLTLLAMILVAAKLPSSGSGSIAATDPATKDVGEGQIEKLKRIDFPGATVMIASTLALLLGLNLASENEPWFSPLSISLLVGAVVLAAIFVLIEGKIIATYSIGLLQMIAQVELIFAVPLYFQITMATSASAAGLRLVPAVVGNAVGGLLCGAVIEKTGRYKLLTIGGLLFACLGYALVLVRWHGSTNWAESFYIFPGGFGMGVVQSTTFVALTAAISRKDYAVAGTGLYQSMGIGGSAGSCITMAVMQGALRPLLQKALQLPADDEVGLDTVRNDVQEHWH